MRLCRFVLEGYKRFAERASLETDDHLIALVGPNESGKTTLLKALKRLNDNDGYDSRERTLNWKGETRLIATFTLDDADRETLREVKGGDRLRHFVLTKTNNGARVCEAT